MQIMPHIRRVVEISRREGIVNALMSIQRELIGTLRYHFLKRKQPKGYYVRNVQGSKMYLSVEDPGVSRDLIIRGMREREETRIIQKVLKPGMTVIDIGSNIGYYAMMECRAVTETGHVYAIEPEPHNFELLSRNISLNNYQNVDVFQIGISDKTGSSTLYVSEHSNLHNLLAPLHPKSTGSAITIPVYRLDDFVAEHNIVPSKIDCVRMDIEGYEVKALAGMKEILRAANSLILFIEFHPQYLENIPGYSLESAMDSLDSFGFKIRYAAATGKNGYQIHFRDVSIREFIEDDRVSRTNVFMTFLSNF